jgi:hypothetical protein
MPLHPLWVIVSGMYVKGFQFNCILEVYYTLLPTLILLSGVGTTCFSSCCDKDSAIIFTTGRLPDVNSLKLALVLTIANAAWTNH